MSRIPDTPFTNDVTELLAGWTLRLGTDSLFGSILIANDPHLFGLLYASCAAAIAPPEELRPHSKALSAVEAGDKIISTLKELQRQFGPDTSGRFANLYLDGLSVFAEQAENEGKLRQGLERWAEIAEELTERRISVLEENADRLADLLELERLERDLLVFQMGRSQPGFKNLFDLLLDSERFLGAQMALAAILGISTYEITRVLSESSTLVRSGLVRVVDRPFRLIEASPHLREALCEPADNDKEFFARFIKPLTVSPSTASLARLDDRDHEILLRLLQLPLPEDRGLHALIYGPSTIDKRDLCARLLEEDRVSGYAVVSRKVPADDLPAWIFIAQKRLMEVDPQAVLVIERAEQALVSRRMSLAVFFGLGEEDERPEDDDRASDAGLTEARIRCLWLTDRGQLLSERNLGRFLFHCEARPGSRGERRDRIKLVVGEFDLSRELEHDLAKYSFLGEQQVRQAATLAKLVAEERHEREQVIRRAVLQSQRILRRDHTEDLRDSVTAYSLDNLNLAGRFTPEQIITALRKKPQGTLCFFGLPGAGKTQLAEFIAVELDVPIVMKRASDLLSKWLGESEQNIASMFREAETEGALLFLDEADSFLRDRSLARAEWAVTQVNEMLQQMERHPGVFIAATNLMRDVDHAALRRFTWKLEFLPLRPDQAWSMFCAESGFDPTSDRDRAEQLRALLATVADLTPGDFATVKRQANMLDEELSPEEWIEQLDVEAKAKMVGIKRHAVGFAPGVDVVSAN